MLQFVKIVGLLYWAFVGNLSENSPFELVKNTQKEDDVPTIQNTLQFVYIVALL